MTTSVKEIDWSQLSEGMPLSRAEFDQLGECRGLERLNGRLCLPPAAFRHRDHGQPHAILAFWATSYIASTSGIEISVASTVKMDADNDPEPDLSLFRTKSFGGRVILDPEGYLVGAPELAAEVSASTTYKDLTVKYKLYQKHGVNEYIVWNTEVGKFDWFELHDGRYQLRPTPEDGIYRSSVFPGLWLDYQSLQAFDYQGVLATLQSGFATPEHAKFVQQLAVARGST